MKRFILKTLVFVLLIPIICISICHVMLQVPDDGSKYSHRANVRLSKERLQRYENMQKMVLIGGSGCGFGFYSKLLQDHYQMPVINTGTHASIGLWMQNQMYKELYHKGDILLLIPEYQQFEKRTFWGIENDVQYYVLYNYYQDALQLQTLRQRLACYRFAYEYYNVAQHNKGIIPNSSNPSPYSIFALNEYGDVEFFNLRVHKDNIPLQHISSQSFYGESIHYLSKFITDCEAQGITCILFPPAFMESSYKQSNAFIDKVAVELEKANIPFAVPTERYCLADTLFYDTTYHLTGDGAILRTNMIIEDLDSILQARQIFY